MKILQTFNIYFFLKKRSIRKNGTIPIYARIVVDGHRADLSTKEETREVSWCAHAGRVNSKVKIAKSINENLDRIYYDLADCKKQLQEEGRLLSAQAVKLCYTKKDAPLRTLNDLLQ